MKKSMMLFGLLLMSFSFFTVSFSDQYSLDTVIDEIAEELLPFYVLKKMAYEDGKNDLFLQNMLEGVDNVTPEEKAVIQAKARELVENIFKMKGIMFMQNRIVCSI